MMTTIALVTILLVRPQESGSGRRFQGIVLAGCFGSEAYLLIRTGTHPILAALSGFYSAWFIAATLATFVDLEILRNFANRNRAGQRESGAGGPDAGRAQ
jgi:hypothetical protein